MSFSNYRSLLRSSLAILIMLAPLSAFAQFTSNVQGTVTDSSGAVVSGAGVTLTNVDTNSILTFQTSASGQYYFNRLAPGLYRVTVHAVGFQDSVREERITTEQTAGIDIHMSAGTKVDVIVSSDEGHGINPDETRLQYTLSSREIEEFPLQNRATLGLLRVAPGATGIDEGQENVSVNRTSAAESANGRSNAGNIFLLDFIPINSQLGGFSNTNSNGGGSGSAVFVPHPDMIAEVALETTTFSVENSAGTGLQTNITTKSGANLFHGDADYTYTSHTFAATAPLESSTAVFRRQYVGGALGGPIWKDHTFFFGSYFNQQVANANTGSSNFYAPEFVAWAQQFYPNSQGIQKGLIPNPASRAKNVTTVAHGSDMDSSCNLNPSAPSTTIGCNLPVEDVGTFDAPQTNNGAQYNLRLDHSLRGDKDKIYVSYFRFDQKSISARIQPTLDGSTPSTGYYIAGNYTHMFSPSLLNQASFGQTRYNFNYGLTPHSQNDLLLPYFSGCFCAGGLVGQFLEDLTEHQTYGRDSVSWVRGRHNLTFGFQGSFNNEVSDNSAVYARPFFQANYTIYNYLNDVTDLELIYTISAQTGNFFPQKFGAGSTRFGAYVQDSWKVTPNLLIGYGIRWDDFGNPATYGTNAEPFANVILGGSGSFTQQVAGASSQIVSNVYSSSRNKNFLPRGSFAYTLPGSDSKTILRGGIGLYEDDLNLNQVAANLPTQPPVRLSLTLGQSSSPKAVTSYGTTTVQGPPGGNPYGFIFPAITIDGYDSKGAPLDPSGNVIVGDLNGSDRDLKPSKAIIYNFGLEQEMPKHLVVGITYSGSHGYDNLILPDVNTYAGLTSVSTNTRYNPDFGHIKIFRNGGTSNYDALIASVRQTIGKLTYQASYTWGKALGTPVENLTDQQNISSQYTLQNGDVRNRFSFSQVYEVPAHFSNNLLNRSLGGWSISNVIVAQSGTPFTVADTSGSNDYNNDSVFYDIPLYAGTRRSFSRSDARTSAYMGTSVFSGGTKAFIAPSANQEGGLQNTFHGPGYFSLDTGLNKKIEIPWFRGEKATLALRTEAINLLNHANFQNPSSEYSNGGTFGVVQNAYQGRILQLGGRFEF
jgi:hypothetical protein